MEAGDIQATCENGRGSAIDGLVLERDARRGDGDLLEVLEELPHPIPGVPSDAALKELRQERH